MIVSLILTMNFSDPSSLQLTITVLFTVTLFLHNAYVVFHDVTYSSPTNDEVTVQVHGRPILPKSANIADPDLNDPSHIATVL